MKISKMFAAAVLTAVVSGAASAQTSTINCGGATEAAIGATCIVSNTVSATIASVARLSITGPATTVLTAPLAADFGTAGSGNQVLTTGPSLAVSANVAHTVTASSPTNFSGPGTKPATDLQIKINGGAPTAIGTIGFENAPTNLATYNLVFGTKYNWTVDVPGTYTLALTFTLTSP